MKLVRVKDLFRVEYGVNLELNRLVEDPEGINFVGRSSQNNGVTAKVQLIPDIEPNPSGTISVAGGGSVMESFLQPEPYYSGRDLYYLEPLIEMTDSEKIYYCVCLRANKFRFNYGRQPNRSLQNLKVPAKKSIPKWVNKVDFDKLDGLVSDIVKEVKEI